MEIEEITALNRTFKEYTPEQILEYFISRYKGEIALSTSMSMEDQILTHMVCNIDKETRIFTLDTGRLFPETYDLIDKTTRHYNKNIEVFFPNHTLVEQMVKEKSINLFYDSVESRRECCQIRKIEPLRRAFKGLKVWICGLRQEQSITRFGLNPVELDGANEGVIKISPLYNWSAKMVRDYIEEHNIPYNPLCDKGYPSIGCQPCTRAVQEGEDERAGRWWWESRDTKECGLHKIGKR
ncbi:MAG: phosphoadenylyl-sulfate reductase [Rikenellaceae bacterium]